MFCEIQHVADREERFREHFAVRVIAAFLVFNIIFLFISAGRPNAGQSDMTVPAGQKQIDGEPGSSKGDFDEFGSGGGFEGFDEFDTGSDSGRKDIYDPLSGYNRFMTRVNDKLYFWVLKPAASGYAAVTPKLVRKAVNKFFNNLGYPVRFVNNMLQFKIRRAGVETARFVVNTTLGIAGFADPAERWLDLEPYPEDFGQTLGVYGVGEGFYLVLPFFGPSNLRDSLAKIPDVFLDPLYYLEPSEASIGLGIYDRINYTSLHLGEYESLKKDAVDWYVFMRSAYNQNRETKIKE